MKRLNQLEQSVIDSIRKDLDTFVWEDRAERDIEAIHKGDCVGYVKYKVYFELKKGMKSGHYLVPNDPDEFKLDFDDIEVNIVNQFGEPHKNINRELNKRFLTFCI